MPETSEVLALLEDRGVSPSLVSHLQGTRDILRAWNLPEPVCLAGLCHNLYGTETFRGRFIALADRDRLRSRIGDEAERLVYLYCRLERGSLFLDGVTDVRFLPGTPPQVVSGAERGSLLHLEIANTLEQFPVRWLVGRARLSLDKARWQRVVHLLTPAAQARLRSEWSAARLLNPWLARLVMLAWQARGRARRLRRRLSF